MKEEKVYCDYCRREVKKEKICKVFCGKKGADEFCRDCYSKLSDVIIKKG